MDQTDKGTTVMAKMVAITSKSVFQTCPTRRPVLNF